MIVTFTRNKLAKVMIIFLSEAKWKIIALSPGQSKNAVGLIIRIRVPDGKCALWGKLLWKCNRLPYLKCNK